MAFAVGELHARLTADARQFQAGMRQAQASAKLAAAGIEGVQGSAVAAQGAVGGLRGVAAKASAGLDKLGLSGTAAGAVLGGGVAFGALTAGRAVVKFGADSVRAASAVEEQMTASEVIFKGFADEVQTFADESAIGFNLSERAALEAANAFGNLFTVVGIGSREAAQFSTILASLAGDVASFRDVSVEQALVALRAGLVGETEPLRRLGVFLSEARVQAEAFALGYEAVNGELSDQAKVAARLSLILKDTEQAQGDAERTSGNFANQSRRLNANLEDLQATVGEALVPALADLAETANAVLGPLGELISMVNEFDGLDFKGIPLLEDVVPRLRDFLDSAGLVSAEEARMAREGTRAADAGREQAEAYRSAASSLRDTESAARGATDGYASLREEIETVESAFFAARDAEDRHADALREVDDATADLARAKMDLADASRDEARAQSEANREIERALFNIERAQFGTERAAKALRDAQREAGKAAREHAEAVNDFGPNSKAARDAAVELEDANFAVRESEFGVREAAEEVVDAHDALRDANDRVRDSADRVRDAQDRVEDASRRVERAQRDLGRATIDLESALQDEVSAFADLNGGAAGFIDKLLTLQEMYPRQASLLQPWLDRAKELASTLATLNVPADFSTERLQHVGSGGALDSIGQAGDRLLEAAAALQAAADLWNDIDFHDTRTFTPKATGGITTGPEFALIGEAGREAVLPLTNMRRSYELLQQSGILPEILRMAGVRRMALGGLVGAPAPRAPSAPPVATVGDTFEITNHFTIAEPVSPGRIVRRMAWELDRIVRR